MDEAAVTLKQLLALTEQVFQSTAGAAVSASAQVPPLREELQKQLKASHWLPVVNEIGNKIAELFDIRLIDILAAAWGKWPELRKYCDSQTYPPHVTILAPLAEHELRSEHHPAIEAVVNGQVVGKIEFDVTLRMKLSGCLLRIQDAKITALLAGSCEGKGTIALEKIVLAEKDFGTLHFPGAIELESPVDLRSSVV
jgi:hypothetical protein